MLQRPQGIKTYASSPHRQCPQRGTRFAEASDMGWICQHCGAPFIDPPHRVVSEESGVVLLDLIVCHLCHVQAQKLGLRSEEMGREIKDSAASERQARH